MSESYNVVMEIKLVISVMELLSIKFMRFFILFYFFTIVFNNYVNLYLFLSLSAFMFPAIYFYTQIRLRDNIIMVFFIYIFTAISTFLFLSGVIMDKMLGDNFNYIYIVFLPGLPVIFFEGAFRLVFDTSKIVHVMHFCVTFCFYCSLFEWLKLIKDYFYKGISNTN